MGRPRSPDSSIAGSVCVAIVLGAGRMRPQMARPINVATSRPANHAQNRSIDRGERSIASDVTGPVVICLSGNATRIRRHNPCGLMRVV